MLVGLVTDAKSKLALAIMTLSYLAWGARSKLRNPLGHTTVTPQYA